MFVISSSEITRGRRDKGGSCQIGEKMRKELRGIVDYCKREGLAVQEVKLNGKHAKILCAQGTVVVPTTPSEYRSILNTRSYIRRLAKGAIA